MEKEKLLKDIKVCKRNYEDIYLGESFWYEVLEFFFKENENQSLQYYHEYYDEWYDELDHRIDKLEQITKVRRTSII